MKQKIQTLTSRSTPETVDTTEDQSKTSNKQEEKKGQITIIKIPKSSPQSFFLRFSTV